MGNNRKRPLIHDVKNKVLELYQESGKQHFLITGSKGIGKSTFLQEILRDQRSYGGIITRLILDSNQHPQHVLLEDILNNKRSAMVGVINRSGTAMVPIAEGFEELGTEILAAYRNSDKELIVFDEIGYLESHTIKYRQEIARCFQEKKIIAVLRKSNHTFIHWIKSMEDTFLADLDEHVQILQDL